MFSNSRYIYTEGFAVAKAVGFPLDHAWLTDKTTGKAVEITWEEPGIDYFGMPMIKSVVQKSFKVTREYSVLRYIVFSRMDAKEALYLLKEKF